MRYLLIVPPLTTKIPVFKDTCKTNIMVEAEKLNNKHILSQYRIFKDNKCFETRTHTPQHIPNMGENGCSIK